MPEWLVEFLLIHIWKVMSQGDGIMLHVLGAQVIANSPQHNKHNKSAVVWLVDLCILHHITIHYSDNVFKEKT